MQRKSRRFSAPRRLKTFVAVILVATAIFLTAIARPTLHLAFAAWRDPKAQQNCRNLLTLQMMPVTLMQTQGNRTRFLTNERGDMLKWNHPH